MRLLSRKQAISLLMAFGFEMFIMDNIVLSRASHRDADALSQAGVIYVATVRKDGSQSKAAPVWFTTTSESVILMQTATTTWKAKRIRRGSPVIVWIGSRGGPAFIGKAEITSDQTAINKIVEDYPKKYLLARFGYHRPGQEMFTEGRIVAIKITPVRDFPDGFVSAPGTRAPQLGDVGASRTNSSARR
jgi:general stress protein 26